MKTEQQLQSVSAVDAYLNKDGLLNVEALLRLRVRVDKQMKQFKPAVKYVKAAGGKVKAIITLPVNSKKEANAITKAVTEGSAAISSSVTGDKGKFVLSVITDTAKAAKAAYDVVVGMPGLTPVPESYFVSSKKAKTIAYSAAKDKAQTPAYLKRRVLKVVTRRKLTDAVTPMLPVYAKGVLPKELETALKEAQTAITRHIKKAESVRVKIAANGAKLREERSAEYGELVKEIKTVLTGAGFKEANMVMSQSMMGQTLLVKTPSGRVMSIGLSDPANFNKARKAATTAAE